MPGCEAVHGLGCLEVPATALVQTYKPRMTGQGSASSEGETQREGLAAIGHVTAPSDVSRRGNAPGGVFFGHMGDARLVNMGERRNKKRPSTSKTRTY